MEKHIETVRELNQRGFNVYSLDWRGQGGSSRLLANRLKGHVNSYGDYLSDLTAFYHTILRPNLVEPLIVLAHSMGGHIALRFLHEQPSAVSRMVLLSPMIDIHTEPVPRCVAMAMSRVALKVGLAEQYCFGRRDYAASLQQFENNRLTSDVRRFFDMHAAIKKAPLLATGGITWGWLFATFQSIKLLYNVDYLNRIRVPILMLSAEKDRIVTRKAQEAVSAKLPNSRLFVIPGSRHEILKENDAIRAIFWCAFDRFEKAEGSVSALANAERDSGAFLL